MNGYDPPVEARGDEEGWGDVETDYQEEPRSFSLDCDRWMHHLCHHLNTCKKYDYIPVYKK